MSYMALSSEDEAKLLEHYRRLEDVLTEFCEVAEEQLGHFATPWVVRFQKALDGIDTLTVNDQLQWHGNAINEDGDLILARCMSCGLNNSFTMAEKGKCANCGWPGQRKVKQFPL